MSIEAVLERASALGISLTVDGNRIGYTPKANAPPDFVETLRERKPEILAHLRHVDSLEDVDLPGVWIEAKDVVAITCPACGYNEWWLHTQGGAAWVCGVCHPQPPKVRRNKDRLT